MVHDAATRPHDTGPDDRPCAQPDGGGCAERLLDGHDRRLVGLVVGEFGGHALGCGKLGVGVTADGSFGPATERAVIAWKQKMKFGTVNGKVDAYTWSAMARLGKY